MSLIHSIKGYFKLKKYMPAEIIIYSESKAYYTNFKLIIDELIEKYNRKIIYITSDMKDPVLNKETNNFIPVYIGTGFMVILAFNYLKSKILLTTMPDVDTFHLKRSPYVENMIYVNHSLVSMNMIYLPKAFESYDTIFAAGPHHEKEIREMEQEYHTKEKQIIKAGYPALDDFIIRYHQYKNSQNINKNNIIITIAPSWQESNIIDLCVYDLIDTLLETGVFVKLRPHPMTIKYEMDKVDKIREHYKENSNFVIDNSPGNFTSYLDTDIMITDWSGTVYKYCFTTFKPVIFINTPIKVNNDNYKNYKNIPVDISWRNSLGRSIDIENITSIKEIIKELLNDKNIQDKIVKFRDNNVYNLCSSGKVCAAYINDYLTEHS